MKGFLKDLTIREACFKCNFKYPSESKADITIGDLWGIQMLAPELDNDEGTTLVIANTKKGEELITDTDCLKDLSIDEVSRFNPAITSSPSRPANRDKFIEDTNPSLIEKLERWTTPTAADRIIANLNRIKSKIGSIIRSK